MATGLATRCTACGTIFRVVPDQLRVSDGWVRCGRCNEVFNAGATLIDLETGSALVASDPPPPAPPAPPGPPPQPPRPTAPNAAPTPAPPPTARAPVAPLPAAPARIRPAPMPAPSPATAPQRTTAAATPPPPPPPPAVGGWNRRREPSLPIEPSWGTPEVNDTPHEPSSDLPVVDDAASRFPAAMAEQPLRAGPPPELPSFVRRAERARRWRSTPVRAVLGVLAVVAGLALALQVLHEWRDVVAARQPALRTALEAGCAALGCRIDAPRSIEGLTVESSGLVRVEKSAIYKLNVSLRNRSGVELTLPALELSLNDAQGQLVARRVLNAPELGVNQTTLAAGRELALQATLQAATPPVAGYTIELFYP